MTDDIKKKAGTIYRKLHKLYPDANCELNYKNPLELLVATILSAQCTDVRVNLVTKDLFNKLKTARDYASIEPAELEEAIRSTGFFRQKAKSIQNAAKVIVDRFNGQVPASLKDLTSLPGVGRKTANVVLGNAFNIPGLPVDTHVTRLTNRLGLTKHKDAVKIEFDIMELLPKSKWTMFSHLLIWHGRRVCKARKPLCNECPLIKECNFYEREN